DLFSQGHTVINGRGQAGVAEVETLAKPGADDGAGGFGLLGSDFRGPSGAHLALRQIQNADRVTLADHLNKSSGARQLYVVRMRGDRENVYGFHKRFTFSSS